MDVLLLDIRCARRHNITSYSCLQINDFAKFADTTCVFRDAGAAVGQGEDVTRQDELRTMETYKRQKNRYHLRLFLFINSVYLKSNNRNYRKSF